MYLRYTFPVSFRFTDKDIQQLDSIVAWEKEKGPRSWVMSEPNRTNVLRALIEREVMRLADEKAKVAETLEKAKKRERPDSDFTQILGESATERKSRLQRERRARKREQGATA